jgi:hypothetical protein
MQSTNSQSRKVIVAKNDSATFDTFLPSDSLLAVDWAKVYKYKTGAAAADPNSGFLRDKAKNYGSWSPLDLLGFNNSTYVIISGAHISENPTQAKIAGISCPPNDSTSIDLVSVKTDSVSCTIKGTNLQAVAQIILENAQDSNDHVYGMGVPAISGADQSQGTVTFKVKDLQQLKGTSYKVFYSLKGGTPEATDLKVTVQQQLSIEPENLVFASQTVGNTSTAQSIAVTNRGSAAVSISGISMTGANAGDFSQTNNCGTSIATSASCTMVVTFKPTGTGTRTALVSIADNGPGNPHTIGLSGTGMAVPAPVAGLSATSLDFGAQTVNSSGAAQTVTLTNSGTAALSVTGVNISGSNPTEFAQTNTCGSSVAGGSNCTISITFRPTSVGAKTASLTISDNGPGNPHAIALSGTGVAAPAPVISIAPPSLTFGSQPVNSASATQTVTITNSGNAALSIAGITIGGPNAGDFSQSNTCGSSVAAGGSCTIAVTFTPKSAGSRAGSSSIANNAAGNSQTISLGGTGTAAAASGLNSQSLAIVGSSQPEIGATNAISSSHAEGHEFMPLGLPAAP